MSGIRSISAAGIPIRDGHDNFFTPLRLLFALMVMVGHAFAIAMGDPELEPRLFLDYTPSYLAVNLFFIASGFLVTRSMLMRRDAAGFAAARLLRIYPALIVHVLFLILVLGPVATRLPLTEYFADPDLWLEPFRILSFVNTDAYLPGVFETNAEQYASLPLWTLRFEMLCYLATLLAFCLGLMRKRWMLLAQFVLPAMALVLGRAFGLFDGLPGSVENAARFGSAYGLGAILFAYRDHIRIHWIAVPLLAGLSWMIRDTVVVELTVNVLLAVILFGLAYIRQPRLAGLQRLPDLSYGLYIYHWGVMQLAFHWWPGLGVASLFAVSLLPVILLSWISWTWIEKPMLSRKTVWAERLRFRKPSEASISA